MGFHISTDACWGGFHSLNGDVSSRTGIFIRYGTMPVLWVSARQKLTGTNWEENPVLVETEDEDLDDYIALSSCEAEGVAAQDGTKRALHMMYVASEMDIATTLPVQINIDASAFIAFSQNIGVGRMKHLDMRSKWIGQVRDRRTVEFIKVDGELNESDYLTKIFEKLKSVKWQDQFTPEMPMAVRQTLGEDKVEDVEKGA